MMDMIGHKRNKYLKYLKYLKFTICFDIHSVVSRSDLDRTLSDIAIVCFDIALIISKNWKKTHKHLKKKGQKKNIVGK